MEEDVMREAPASAWDGGKRKLFRRRDGGQKAGGKKKWLLLLAAVVAVGAVVLNRVRSSAFPNTISEVVYQSGQFTPASSGILAQTLAQGADSDCYEAARAALNGENPVGGCLYFNSGYGQGIQIGNQHFY